MTTDAPVLTLARIEALFLERGAAFYGGEQITQTEHALQCASLAQAAGEPESVIVAALLHDIGHLLDGCESDLRHQDVAAHALSACFDAAVVEPVRLHVAAKRYLCAIDPTYWAGLSPASKESLVWQGGAYDQSETQNFAAQPHAMAAVRVRRYDDQAKALDCVTPSFAHFMPMVQAASLAPPRDASTRRCFDEVPQSGGGLNGRPIIVEY